MTQSGPVTVEVFPTLTTEEWAFIQRLLERRRKNLGEYSLSQCLKSIFMDSLHAMMKGEF